MFSLWLNSKLMLNSLTVIFPPVISPVHKFAPVPVVLLTVNAVVLCLKCVSVLSNHTDLKSSSCPNSALFQFTWKHKRLKFGIKKKKSNCNKTEFTVWAALAISVLVSMLALLHVYELHLIWFLKIIIQMCVNTLMKSHGTFLLFAATSNTYFWR